MILCRCGRRGSGCSHRDASAHAWTEEGDGNFLVDARALHAYANEARYCGCGYDGHDRDGRENSQVRVPRASAP